MENIAIGIVSGLLTAFLVIVIRKLWVSVVVPWYEECIYKDAHIEGTWEGVYPELELKEIITLKRNSHFVEGIIAIVEGPDQGKTYEVTGTFKNLILTASYNSLNKQNLDRGTYTLMLRNNGSSLEGYSAFYEDDSNKIMYGNCVWNRKSS